MILDEASYIDMTGIILSWMRATRSETHMHMSFLACKQVSRKGLSFGALLGLECLTGGHLYLKVDPCKKKLCD